MEHPLGAWREACPRFAEVRCERLVLRAAPSPDAEVVATLRASDVTDSTVDVLESRGSFLRVASPRWADGDAVRVEGWAEWGDVVPGAAALVVDTATGDIVAGVPLELGMSAIAFSPTGLRAVISSPRSSCGGEEGSNDVYEVRTSDFSITRVVRTLEGEFGWWSAGDGALSSDGSEMSGLFAETLVTISTRTGAVLRRTKITARDRDFVSLNPANVVGATVLLGVVREGERVEMRPGIWVCGGSTSRAERRFEYACEAAGARFAVDDEGERLYRLTPDGAVAEALPISRPDQVATKDVTDEDAQPLVNVGLEAYPDASRVVLFVGFEYG